jgi:tetratricopeptide (TPR) repeat protein
LIDFDTLWDYNDPAGTEEKFRALLPEAKAAGDATLLELETQIARTLGLQRKFDEAHTALDSVEKRLGDLSRPRVRYLLERGRVFNSSGRKEQAEPLFLEAYNLAKSGGFDFYAIDAAHMMALVTPPEQQIEWNERALEMCEDTSDERAAKWRGSLYNNLGWTYHDMGRLDEALDVFQRGVEFRAKMGQEEPLRVAKWCVARCLRSLGRTEEALASQQELLAEGEAAGRADMYVLEEMGECLYALGRVEEAKPYFARAYAEMSKDEWLKANEAGRLERLRELSN